MALTSLEIPLHYHKYHIPRDKTCPGQRELPVYPVSWQSLWRPHLDLSLLTVSQNAAADSLRELQN